MSAGDARILVRPNGASFDAPHAWENRSIHVFMTASPRPEGSTSNLVVTEEARLPGEDARAHLLRYLEEIRRQVPQMRILYGDVCRVAGRPAARVRFTWRTDCWHEQIRVHVSPAPEDTAVLTFSVTANPAAISSFVPGFEELLASVRFGDAARELLPPARVLPPARTEPFAFPAVPMPGVTSRP